MPGQAIDLPDGARLVASRKGAGPDLLLVSGLGGTARFWDPCIAGLEASFRVTRFDQRGIGASTRGEAAVDIDRLAGDTLVVADALGLERPILVGHSTGGAIGQAFARMAPGRLGGLVLSATWLRPSRYMTALFEARRRILDSDPVAYATTGAVLGYAPAWLERNWDAYEAATARPLADEAARRVVRERIDALLGFDGSAHVASLALPILVLGARDDVIVPAFLQDELAAALPAASVAFYPDGGHFFPVTRTEDFVRSVATFARQPPSVPKGIS